MKTSVSTFAKFAVAIAVLCGALQSGIAQDTASPLNLTDGNRKVHILPLPGSTRSDAALAPGALTFHGGPVMSNVTTFAIYWMPPTLQNGSATTITSHYRAVQQALLEEYPGHGIGNNNTQYDSSCLIWSVWGEADDFHCNYLIQLNGTVDSYYVQNKGSLGGSYVDKSPYPSGGCTNPLTGGNCISDADLRAEIQKDLPALAKKGWTGSLNQMILVYTSSGEGSCFGDGLHAFDGCSYQAPPVYMGTGYCGYHSYIDNSGLAVIYSNEPYLDRSSCQAPWATSPSNDPAADSAASVASHELSEAITDPLINAWYQTGTYAEIGDLCNFNYGTNTWDLNKSGTYLANQLWDGVPFELQMQYDNHTGSCVQVGP